MDLIQEYYDNRGYDYEFNRKIELKHKKIITWQKKIKTKTNISAATKKFSKLKLKISQTSLHSTKAMSFANVGDQYNHSKLVDALLSFNTKCDDDATSWRFTNAPTLDKSAGPIEKFDYFENKIRESFHRSYEEYFPDSAHVLDDVLNLMFQKADNSFTECIKVNSKQIRVVPDMTAKYLNVKASLWDQIHKLVIRDVKTSKKYNALPRSAFGKTFQNQYKIEPRANDFKTRWQSYAKHTAKHEDLETFAAVWKNITHLQTTRKFCMWLANNPNVAPPAFLENEGLLRDNLSFDFSANSDSIYDEYVAPNEIIDRPYRTSRTQTRVVTNTSDSSDSSASLGSVDISDINIIV